MGTQWKIGIVFRAMALVASLLLCACTTAGENPSPPRTLGDPDGLACKVDSDCAIKDAGSCCGYRPVCVNKDTPTFPEQVQATCAKEGKMGICGFPVVDGCQCVAGKCQGAPMLENSAPVQ